MVKKKKMSVLLVSVTVLSACVTRKKDAASEKGGKGSCLPTLMQSKLQAKQTYSCTCYEAVTNGCSTVTGHKANIPRPILFSHTSAKKMCETAVLENSK